MTDEAAQRSIQNACARLRTTRRVTGTGYLVTPDRVATCHHVVQNVAKEREPVECCFGDTESTQRKAYVIDSDPKTDSAILRLDTPVTMPPLPLYDGPIPASGHRRLKVRALGFPDFVAETENSGLSVTLHGSITNFPPRAPGNIADALELSVDEFKGELPDSVGGFSGSPVLIGRYVIGHLSSVLGSLEAMQLPHLTKTYAVRVVGVRRLLGWGPASVIELPEMMEDDHNVPPIAAFRFPGPGTRTFVGRDRELSEIEALLTRSADVQVREAITGLPGMGKTELARQVAARLWRTNKFPGGILWFSAESGDLRQQWAKYAEDLDVRGLSELDTRAAWAVRQIENRAQRGERILIILDNVVAWAPKPSPLPDVPAVRMLVTTQLRSLDNSFHYRKVEPLELHHARQLLHDIAGRDLEHVDDLLRELAGHALRVELAATYLREFGASPGEYLKELLEGKDPGSSVVDHTSYGATQDAAFRVLWQRILPDLRQGWLLAAQLPPVWFSSELANAIGLDGRRRSGLVSLHLLDRHQDQRRHQMHRLLRDFALAEVPDTSSVRDAVITGATQHLETGDRALRFQRYDRDADSFKHLLETLPDDRGMHLKAASGIALQQLGDLKTARTLLEAAHESAIKIYGYEHPEVAIWRAHLASVLHDLGELSISRALYEQALAVALHTHGEGNVEVATRRADLAGVLQAQGAYVQAEPLYERALSIREQLHGPDHPDVAASLNDLASLYQAQGTYAKAEPLYRRALDIRERALGVDHPDVAASLNDLASLYQAQGVYSHAEPLYERALEIREHLHGAEHPVVATSLNNLAGLYQVQGRYTDAERLYKRALKIRERLLGAEHPVVATSLNNLAELYQVQGRYSNAEPLYRRALCIREDALGAEHLDVAASLHDLASLCQAQGAYARAEPLYERALRIREHVLGAGHPAVATSLNNLAGLYQARGMYAQAEPLYEHALRIREHSLRVEHPDLATSLNNLAGLYVALGAYARAEPLYERALRIREYMLGKEHPDVAISLNSLAMLYQVQGNYSQAEPLYDRALSISVAALGDEHPAVAALLNNLAGLLHAKGEYVQAEPLYKRALSIRERGLGATHPDVASSLSCLAGLYQAQAAYPLAESLYDRALHIYETALGAEHPEVATSFSNLAVLCWTTGDASRARGYFERAVALRERHRGLTLASLPEPRKREFLQSQRGEAELLVSFHSHGAPNDSDALALTLTATLRRKGRLVAEITSEQAVLRRNLPRALQGELDALEQRRAELEARRQAGSDPRHVEAIATLEREVARLEGELRRKSAVFRAHADPITIESVQAALPTNAVLVEFVHYQRVDPSSREQPLRESLYVAYVLQREGPPRWVTLGHAEPIDAAVEVALLALTDLEHDARDALRNLDELIFAPIRRLLGPTDHFLLSPDAALHLVPFAALVDEQGRYLLDRMVITYVTSGRDLVRPVAQDARSKPLVVAAPDYAGRLPPLPGAEAEARAVQKYFPDVDVYLGPDATKDKLTTAHGPLFVHIATHAFSHASRGVGSGPSHRERSVPAAPEMPPPAAAHRDIDLVENALDEAGLMFAGRNNAEAFLTAREIAGIDLHGTQLVVLAGCDTGRGEIVWSEGISGLRRAFTIAGAETQVVSLWKVADQETYLLMDRYYGELRGGGGRSKALRHAQLELLHDEKHAHPYYWAAFVLIGDERPLQLARFASAGLP